MTARAEVTYERENVGPVFELADLLVEFDGHDEELAAALGDVYRSASGAGAGAVLS